MNQCSSFLSRLRTALGCWLTERWRLEFLVRAPVLSRGTGLEWAGLCNRGETLLRGDQGGFQFDGEESSWLTVCRRFPKTGGSLLGHSLTEWPILFSAAGTGFRRTDDPKISVILPVRGTSRGMLLLAVVDAFAAQRGVEFEVIVVEESEEPEIEGLLPKGTRYLHLFSEPGRQFNKSRAMNEGVKVARSPWVLLHDGDLLPPGDYLREILLQESHGAEAARLLRFIFFLDEVSTARICAERRFEVPRELSEVQQNNPGLSTAVRRDVYWELGGHDECFVGWGGEDNEFLDRLKTKKLEAAAYLPAVHLWHAPAPKKESGDRNLEQYRLKMSIPTSTRIQDQRVARESSS